MEKTDGTNEKQWLEAGLCGDGSRQAAGDREQGRQSQPRRRTPAEREPLNRSSSKERNQRRFARAGRRFLSAAVPLRNTVARFALICRGLSD